MLDCFISAETPSLLLLCNVAAAAAAVATIPRRPRAAPLLPDGQKLHVLLVEEARKGGEGESTFLCKDHTTIAACRQFGKVAGSMLVSVEGRAVAAKATKKK